MNSHFAAAHAKGEELRKQRRQRCGELEPPKEEQSKKSNPPRVGYCPECGRYVAGWHAGCPGTPTVLYENIGDAYHDRLQSFTDKPLEREHKNIPAEWREPPGFPGYLLHSVTRELRTVERTITAANGRTRTYSAKILKAVNGSYSLSVNGVKCSRGVAALWAETFPEYAGKKPKKTGEAVRIRRPERLDSDGAAEYVGQDGVHVVTRPK